MVFRNIAGLLSGEGADALPLASSGPPGNAPARPARYFPLSLSRFNRITVVSGWALPSSIRFVDCQLIVFASRRVMTLLAVRRLPSRSVAVVLLTHLSPSRVQTASAKPPPESNSHERIFFS